MKSVLRQLLLAAEDDARGAVSWHMATGRLEVLNDGLPSGGGAEVGGLFERVCPVSTGAAGGTGGRRIAPTAHMEDGRGSATCCGKKPQEHDDSSLHPMLEYPDPGEVFIGLFRGALVAALLWLIAYLVWAWAHQS